MKFYIILLIALFAFASAGIAQNSNLANSNSNDLWNLEKCISYALQNNLTVQSQILTREQQRIALERSKMSRYPSLNSTIGHNYNFGRAIDPFTNQFVNQRIQSNNFNLSSNVTLYNGNRINNTIERDQLQMEKSQSDLLNTKNTITNNVVLAYLNVVSTQQTLKTAIQQDSTTAAQIDLVAKLVEGGRLNRGELLNLKAQKANDQLTLRRSEADLTTAYLNLKQLLQVDPQTSFEIEIPNVDDISSVNTSDLESVIQKSYNELPSIVGAEQQLKIAKLNEEIAKSGTLPRLSMFANLNSVYSESRKEAFNEKPTTVEIGYVEGSGANVLRDAIDFDTRTTPFGSQLGDNFGQSVGLSLSVPIYNNNQVKSQIANAKIGNEQAEINLNLVKNSIRADITNAYNDLSNSFASYNAALENEKAQRENYSFSEKRFNSGLITSTELILARSNWQQSQFMLQRAKYQLLASKALVNFYRTGEISLK